MGYQCCKQKRYVLYYHADPPPRFILKVLWYWIDQNLNMHAAVPVLFKWKDMIVSVWNHDNDTGTRMKPMLGVLYSIVIPTLWGWGSSVFSLSPMLSQQLGENWEPATFSSQSQILWNTTPETMWRGELIRLICYQEFWWKENLVIPAPSARNRLEVHRVHGLDGLSLEGLRVFLLCIWNLVSHPLFPAMLPLSSAAWLTLAWITSQNSQFLRAVLMMPCQPDLALGLTLWVVLSFGSTHSLRIHGIRHIAKAGIAFLLPIITL